MKMLKELTQMNVVQQLKDLYEEFKELEKALTEAYRLPSGLPLEQLIHMVDVAKRALELAARLPEEEQDYHMDRVSMILERIQRAIRRRKRSVNPETELVV